MSRLPGISRFLEITVVVVAVAGLLFRATLYWTFPVPDGARYGTGDLIEFGVLFALFMLGGACAVTAIPLHLNAKPHERGVAFRPAVVGITAFVVYYLLAPEMPRLL